MFSRQNSTAMSWFSSSTWEVNRNYKGGCGQSRAFWAKPGSACMQPVGTLLAPHLDADDPLHQAADELILLLLLLDPVLACRHCGRRPCRPADQKNPRSLRKTVSATITHFT